MTRRSASRCRTPGEAGDDDAANAERDAGMRDAGPGTRYMLRRAAEARQLPAVGGVLHAGVAGIIEEERVERGQSLPHR